MLMVMLVILANTLTIMLHVMISRHKVKRQTSDGPWRVIVAHSSALYFALLLLLAAVAAVAAAATVAPTT